MSIVCSRLPVFHPSKQFHAPRCPRPLLAGTFIDEVYRYIFEKWGVERHGVIWLTVQQNLLPTYQKVMILQQTVQEECLLDLRSLFIKKKVGLEICFNNFQLTIRLKSEQVIARIDFREDPHPDRKDYRLCRWPKPFDYRTIVINTDGSLKDDRAGIGCIFRTSVGEPLKAHAPLCEKVKVHLIEVLAVQKALGIAVDDEMTFIVIETESTIAVSLLNTIAGAYSNLEDKCMINNENYLKASSPQGITYRGSSPRDDTDIESFIKTVVKSHARWSHGEDATSMEVLVKALIDVAYSLESFSGWGCRHLLREANKAADFLTKQAVKEEIIYAKPTDYPAALAKIIKNDADDNTWYQRETPTPYSSNIDKTTGWRLK